MMKTSGAVVLALLAGLMLAGCAADANRGVARQFVQAWADNDAAALDRVLSPDFVAHGLPPGIKGDRDGYTQFMKMHHDGFPDFHVRVDDIVCEGDRVARRITWGGTHKGNYMGHAPSNRKVTMQVISIERIANGRVAEQWACGDMMGLLGQMGALPPPKGGR